MISRGLFRMGGRYCANRRISIYKLLALAPNHLLAPEYPQQPKTLIYWVTAWPKHKGQGGIQLLTSAFSFSNVFLISSSLAYEEYEKEPCHVVLSGSTVLWTGSILYKSLAMTIIYLEQRDAGRWNNKCTATNSTEESLGNWYIIKNRVKSNMKSAV